MGMQSYLVVDEEVDLETVRYEAVAMAAKEGLERSSWRRRFGKSGRSSYVRILRWT